MTIRVSAEAILLICLQLTYFVSTATAQDIQVRVASGLPGGTYRDVYARNLERQMRGYDFVYLESAGSGQNLDLLAKGQADLAFAQADVYAARLATDPHRYDGLMVLGRLADECVYIAYRKAGPVTDLAQLASTEGSPGTIAVGSPESGMAGTWSYLVVLDPGLKGVEIDSTADTLAINQLAVGVFDAVGWVTDPSNLDHKMLRATMSNATLAIMSITNPMLLAPLEDGTRIYESRKVVLDSKVMKQEVRTLCTSAMIFTRKDANPRLIGKVSDLVSLDLHKIVSEK
jgi:hypothetical protein